MSTLLQTNCSDEECCESSHYQRSMEYFHSLFGPTYYQDRPLIASQRIIESSYKNKRSLIKKSAKEKTEESFINLNIFQLKYDVLKFLSAKSKPLSTNLVHDWQKKRKWLKEMKSAILNDTEIPEYPESTTKWLHQGCGFDYYPSGLKDFHTMPVFHSDKTPSRTNRRSFQKTIKPREEKEKRICKFCPDSTAALLDPEAWYENYKETVTYAGIPKEHKRKVEEKFKSFYAKASAQVETPLSETARKEFIEAFSFGQFIGSGSATNKAALTPGSEKDKPNMSGSGAPPKLYGPDAIALVSGPEFRRRDREVKRSLPKPPISLRQTKKGQSTKSLPDTSTSEPQTDSDGNILVGGMRIPIPSSRFRYLDDDFKLCNITETLTPPGTPVQDRPMTPVTGSKSISCLIQDVSSVTKSNIAAQQYDEFQPVGPRSLQRARGMASVPHIPGEYGDISALSNRESRSSLRPLKASHSFIAGPGTVSKKTNLTERSNPVERTKELPDGASPKSTIINQDKSQPMSIQLSKESMAKLSAIKPNSNPDEATLATAAARNEDLQNSSHTNNSKKPFSLITSTNKTKASAKREPEVPKRFKKSISTVSLNSPRSKTKPVGLL